MTKTDWTVLFIRLVGLYLIATHFAIFVAGISVVIVVLKQAGMARAGDLQLWQSPAVAAIALAVGLFLVFKARIVTQVIEKHDKA
jgi:hypothetical protein